MIVDQQVRMKVHAMSFNCRKLDAIDIRWSMFDCSYQLQVTVVLGVFTVSTQLS